MNAIGYICARTHSTFNLFLCVYNHEQRVFRTKVMRYHYQLWLSSVGQDPLSLVVVYNTSNNRSIVKGRNLVAKSANDSAESHLSVIQVSRELRTFLRKK